MKKNNFFAFNRLGLTALAVTGLLMLTACAAKHNFLNSQIVPAARGYVQVKEDKNGNYAISVQIDKLAEVERLTPEKSTYVVWMNTTQNEVKNLGQLNSGTSTFSNNLKASFSTVSSFKPSKVFITAESEANPYYPSDKIIITTDNF